MCRRFARWIAGVGFIACRGLQRSRSCVRPDLLVRAPRPTRFWWPVVVLGMPPLILYAMRKSNWLAFDAEKNGDSKGMLVNPKDSPLYLLSSKRKKLNHDRRLLPLEARNRLFAYRLKIEAEFGGGRHRILTPETQDFIAVRFEFPLCRCTAAAEMIGLMLEDACRPPCRCSSRLFSLSSFCHRAVMSSQRFAHSPIPVEAQAAPRVCVPIGS